MCWQLCLVKQEAAPFAYQITTNGSRPDTISAASLVSTDRTHLHGHCGRCRIFEWFSRPLGIRFRVFRLRYRPEHGRPRCLQAGAPNPRLRQAPKLTQGMADPNPRQPWHTSARAVAHQVACHGLIISGIFAYRYWSACRSGDASFCLGGAGRGCNSISSCV
jgi:hypothetical protein